ncbi:MAG: DUF4922 domain-containing protein [Bacteroidales bacterium]|nr:DUF4922 domain-containing protein [Bacteroidales bacterium]
MKSGGLDKFVCDQLSRWPLACANFRALKNVEVKELEIGGLGVRVQFNPARIVSSAAKVDKESIGARKCFLCNENRPQEQTRLKFEGRKGKKYDILVNPYPIFPEHLVIAADRHVPQSIRKRYVDMLDLSKAYHGYIFFYNGPRCGASAPDHQHFQAAGRGLMPLEVDVDRILDSLGRDSASVSGECAMEYVSSVQDADLFHYRKFTSGIFVLRSRTAKSSAKLFYRLLDCAPVPEGDAEPMFNLFTYYSRGEYRSIVVFRAAHRSHHYFSDGPDHLTMSPGCADMAGFFITPLKEDFDKLDSGLLSELLSEVSLSRAEEKNIIWRLTRTQPLLHVGIMSAREIEFEILSDGAGVRKASLREGKIEYDGALYDELFFGENTLSTMFAEPCFVLHGVTIGKNFHWERKETQKFAGSLRVIVEKDRLTAVNVIGVEDYLVSVISSEMKSTASPEFLKAHAVISRSWVMARISSHGKPAMEHYPEWAASVPGVVTFVGGCDRHFAGKDSCQADMPGCPNGEIEHIRWYDHQEHRKYDVCADDHCQRYQGLTRTVGENAMKAVDATWGEVLTFGGEICDARFSKCCGGTMEKFSVCWEDMDYPYLQSLPDTPGPAVDAAQHVFCDTHDRNVLSQVLNDYDLETEDFYRWTVEYGADELSDLVERRSGLGLGRIMLLEPLEKGASGRISRLRITGSYKNAVVGKELEIRRILSETHLKSSAFEVEYLDASGNVVLPVVSGQGLALDGKVHYTGQDGKESCCARIVLHGRGWGHGVGLCQIGAAVMASEGYGYRRILEHYYPGAEVSGR